MNAGTNTQLTCEHVLQVAKVWRPGDGELHLLRGAVRVGGLQVFGGDEDAVTPTPHIHHGAGTPPGGQTGRRPVDPIHLNIARDITEAHQEEHLTMCVDLKDHMKRHTTASLQETCDSY